MTRHVYYIVKTVTDSEEEDVNQIDGSTTRARYQKGTRKRKRESQSRHKESVRNAEHEGDNGVEVTNKFESHSR